MQFNISLMKKKMRPIHNDSNPRMTQMLKLEDKDFRAAIISILKDIKENMLVINEQIETTNKNQMAR